MISLDQEGVLLEGRLKFVYRVKQGVQWNIEICSGTRWGFGSDWSYAAMCIGSSGVVGWF